MAKKPLDHHSQEAQRLDIWLYRTRLFKTRSGAVAAISKGKLRLTRADRTQRIKKPHYNVRAGDGLSFMRGQTLLSVTVTAMPVRRGPAPEARDHYDVNEAAASSVPAGIDKSARSRHIPPA
jgi:ribosome-associated heat shock protein Hsp15